MFKLIFTFFILLIISSNSYSQDRPFLFTNLPQYYSSNSFLRYEAAYGQQTFEPIGVDDFEQNAGLQSNIGKYFTTTDHLGIAFTNGETKLSYQAEMLANIFDGSENRIVDFMAGIGFLHEYSGTNVLMGRAIIGRQFTTWQVYSNLIFEHAFSVGRDPFDLMTTVGFSYNLSDDLKAGIEAVGQDLEGFWESDEAEGGATLYIGPSLNYTIPGTAFSITFGGGEIVRVTHSLRNSEAIRALPYVNKNGFIIRDVISLGL